MKPFCPLLLTKQLAKSMDCQIVRRDVVSPITKNSQTHTDSVLEPDGIELRERLSVAIVQFARFLLLAALIYACWRIGVGGIAVHLQLCVVILTISVLCLVHLLLVRRSNFRTLKAGLIAVAVCWIAYAHLQTVPLPAFVVTALAPGTQAVRADLIDNGLVDLNSAVAKANTGANHVVPVTTLSTVPGLTRRRASRYTLGLGVLFCSLLLFNTRRSRRVFAWTLMLNAVSLACWGIVQSASKSHDLFPGIPNPHVSSCFSTFIYKNAGAAALYSGITLAVGFIYWFHSGYDPKLFTLDLTLAGFLKKGHASRSEPTHADRGHRSSKSRRANRKYGKTNNWIQPFSIGICCLLGILITGLIISQSRGACAATCLAAITMLMLAPRSIRPQDACIGVVFLAVIATAFIWLTDLNEFATRPTERISVDNIVSDPRWDHWKDGVATAIVHAPFGAGIGAYGYAQLAQQSFDSMVWFREAHNQYLETIAEAGVVGFILLSAFCCLVAKMCWSLFKRSASREARGWGLIGLLLLIALAFQSSIDFVAVIPANMLVFAATFGVILAVYQEHGGRRKRRLNACPENVNANPLPNQQGGLLHWVVAGARNSYARVGRLSYATVTLLLLGAAFSSYRGECSSEQCLADTEVRSDSYRPKPGETSSNLAKLDSAIAREHLCAALYQRRAVWHHLRMRTELMEAALATEADLLWEQTNGESVFATFESMAAEPRRLLRAEIVSSPAVEQALADGSRDLAKSLTLNPFVPQAQLAVTFLSPLCPADPQPWSANCRRLSRSSYDLLFANGFVGLLMNDKEVMVDQWHRYLQMTHGRQDFVLAASQAVLEPRELVVDLIPQNRTDLLVAYFESACQSENSSFSPTLLKDALEVTRRNKLIDEGRRNALMARMSDLSGNSDAATNYWRIALANDRRNLNYRYEYAKSLLRCKDYEAAIKQAVLGQTLEPQSTRFKTLAERIETERVRHHVHANNRIAR